MELSSGLAFPLEARLRGGPVAYLFWVDGRRPELERGKVVKVIYFPICSTCCWKGCVDSMCLEVGEGLPSCACSGRPHAGKCALAEGV